MLDGKSHRSLCYFVSLCWLKKENKSIMIPIFSVSLASLSFISICHWEGAVCLKT
jgi:hypothetical protein